MRRALDLISRSRVTN